jgi:hypothetical protein
MAPLIQFPTKDACFLPIVKVQFAYADALQNDAGPDDNFKSMGLDLGIRDRNKKIGGICNLIAMSDSRPRLGFYASADRVSSLMNSDAPKFSGGEFGGGASLGLKFVDARLEAGARWRGNTALANDLAVPAQTNATPYVGATLSAHDGLGIETSLKLYAAENLILIPSIGVELGLN